MYSFIRHTEFLAPKWRAYVTPYSAGFKFSNGVIVWSLWELKQALLTLDEGVIAHHLNQGKNDIADWVEKEIGDNELAEKLRLSDQRWGLVVALERKMMRTLNLPENVAQRWMRKADNSFRFVSGEEIWTVEDLKKTLEGVNEESLEFHYQRYPNDLTVWLADVVGDYFLADALEEADSKDQIISIVDDHLAMLKEVL